LDIRVRVLEKIRDDHLKKILAPIPNTENKQDAIPGSRAAVVRGAVVGHERQLMICGMVEHVQKGLC